MSESPPAVEVTGLCKSYGGTAALDGLDLTVRTGTVHALLGPNGAGKTTAVRIMTTLLRPDAGRALVAGHDAVRDPDEVRYRIGLLGQSAALDEELSGRQNLELFGRLYHLGGRGAARRAAELLERFGLAAAGARPVRQYSGGMRRRLDLAASLIMRPQVLFLDEPTTGLDPRARQAVWQAVRALRDAGTTVLLTTQYLEEADRLAGTITVIDHGRAIAEGTPDQLKDRVGIPRLEVVVRDPGRLAEAAALLGTGTGTGTGTVTDPARRLAGAPAADGTPALTRAVAALAEAGIGIEDIALRRPTLDEVFLHLTGPAADSPRKAPA
ncbi:ATP-binding cassette domain-containing protein [Streptomyces aidingensis]|uniref:ABC-type xenobiotic transporter n=1 Tax=Streptomyces aidingensis TaxID=910347 RepID=A0A1I1R2A3_9ACTN|nr:ATP-binding cassette domain-containing protein [Streptomyces aidingensis]SFD28445.1 ABC-2 type transport system ATP-binding protein [Streptomyces aidingensis]